MKAPRAKEMTEGNTSIKLEAGTSAKILYTLPITLISPKSLIFTTPFFFRTRENLSF